MKVKKILSFSLLVLAILFVSVNKLTVNAAGLSFTKDKTLESATVVDGVKWEKYTANSVSDEGLAGKQVVNVATIKPGSAQVISWAINSGNAIMPSTTLQAAQDFEATHPDYQVIAATNNDYFGSDKNGIFSMKNTSVVDGVVYRENSTSKNMYGLAIGENNKYKLTPVGGQIEVSANYFMDIYDASNGQVIKTVELCSFNELPEAGETSLFYKRAIEASGFEIFELDVVSESCVHTTYYIEGTSKQAVSISSASAISIATSDLEVANLIDAGAKIRVYKTTAGEWAEYDYILGCPAQFLRDGNVLSVEEISDYGGAHVTSAHPRTSIGFKADGSVVIMVIDGRQPDAGMDGVSERENAVAMINEGCINAFNFDGGGSSTFLVLKNGELTCVNSPSDSDGLRPDANHLLVVVPRAEVNYEVEQNVTSEGLVEVSGSASISGFNGMQVVSAEVLVNGISTGQSYEDFKVTLAPAKEYALSLKVTYNQYGKKAVKTLGFKTIVTSGEAKEAVAPVKGANSIEKTALGFQVNIGIDDPFQTITNVSVTYENKTVAVKRTLTGYTANILSKAEKSYEFKVSYTYRTSIGSVVTEELDPIKYTYSSSNVELTPKDFLVTLDENEASEYTAKVEYDENGTSNVQVVIVAGGEEIPYVEGVNVGSSSEVTLKVTYDDNGTTKTMELGTNEFTLIINEYQGTVGDTGDNTKPGGMNCNFGGLFVSSFIASFALLVIILKRK